MARKMVCEWGMSEKLGPLTFGKNEEHIFLGREVARQKGLQRGYGAPDRRGDQSGIIGDCAHRARQILEENLEKLHALARALLERESLDGEEVARILRTGAPFGGAGTRLSPAGGAPSADDAVRLTESAPSRVAISGRWDVGICRRDAAGHPGRSDRRRRPPRRDHRRPEREPRVLLRGLGAPGSRRPPAGRRRYGGGGRGDP